jgi:hypothetical protein
MGGIIGNEFEHPPPGPKNHSFKKPAPSSLPMKVLPGSPMLPPTGAPKFTDNSALKSLVPMFHSDLS